MVCSCFVPVFSGTKIPKLRGKVREFIIIVCVMLFTCTHVILSTHCVNICCLSINWIVFSNYSTPCKSLLPPFSSLFRSLHVPTSPPISTAVMVACHLIYHTVPIPALLRSLHSPVNAIYVHLPIMNPITSVS